MSNEMTRFGKIPDVATLQGDSDIINLEVEEKTSPEFGPISGADICRILEPVIKGDNENKLAVFLAGISAYCADSQLNICMVGRSSSGKTHIVKNVMDLFPEPDVKIIGSCSPTAFFHDASDSYDKATRTYRMEFDDKILAFLDQPNPALLAKMRPIFSHDMRKVRSSITDRTEKEGLRTKHVEFIGHPAVLFCTVANDFDEQETTRALLLSPRLTQEKLNQSVDLAITLHGDMAGFNSALYKDEERNMLKERIFAIKDDGERRVIVPQEYHEHIKGQVGSTGNYQPRSARDASRLMSLIKCFALLNKWQRERREGAIVATYADIEEAVKLWDAVHVSQDCGLPPNVLEVLSTVVGPLYIERYGRGRPGAALPGLLYDEIAFRYHSVFGSEAGTDLFKAVIPLLGRHHFIEYLANPADRRRKLIRLTDKGMSLVERLAERG